MASMITGLFASPCTVDLTLNVDETRKTAFLGKDSKAERAYIFTNGEDIAGAAVVSVKPGKQLDHQGVKVELVGQVVTIKEGRKDPYDFFCLTKDLEPPGAIFESKKYTWKFGSEDMTNETFRGTNVQVRYFVRLSVVRNYMGSVTKEVDFIVQNLYPVPDINPPIKVEVGIDELLQLEFEFERSKYHMKDVIVGKVYFLLVRIKIKHMELNIVRRETIGAGNDAQTESETLTKFEIMDGTPIKDQCVPIRLYLAGLDLTPSYKNVQNKFSVKYVLNLVLIDCEDRRYFKQHEVFFWRQKIA